MNKLKTYIYLNKMLVFLKREIFLSVVVMSKVDKLLFV